MLVTAAILPPGALTKKPVPWKVGSEFSQTNIGWKRISLPGGFTAALPAACALRGRRIHRCRSDGRGRPRFRRGPVEMVPGHPGQSHCAEAIKGVFADASRQRLGRCFDLPLSIRKYVLDEHAPFRVRWIDQQDHLVAYRWRVVAVGRPDEQVICTSGSVGTFHSYHAVKSDAVLADRALDLHSETRQGDCLPRLHDSNHDADESGDQCENEVFRGRELLLRGIGEEMNEIDVKEGIDGIGDPHRHCEHSRQGGMPQQHPSPKAAVDFTWCVGHGSLKLSRCNKGMSPIIIRP